METLEACPPYKGQLCMWAGGQGQACSIGHRGSRSRHLSERRAAILVKSFYGHRGAYGFRLACSRQSGRRRIAGLMSQAGEAIDRLCRQRYGFTNGRRALFRHLSQMGRRGSA
jgi:hypothetical protein